MRRQAQARIAGAGQHYFEFTARTLGLVRSVGVECPFQRALQAVADAPGLGVFAFEREFQQPRFLREHRQVFGLFRGIESCEQIAPAAAALVAHSLVSDVFPPGPAGFPPLCWSDSGLRTQFSTNEIRPPVAPLPHAGPPVAGDRMSGSS